MSEKIDSRYPQKMGAKFFPVYAAIKSPWEKMLGFHDVMNYIMRYDSVLSAVVMQAFRILVPDYYKRTEFMCLASYRMQDQLFTHTITPDSVNVHPFCKGDFVGALSADKGDETALMAGRVNDFGTYRVEKELDVCEWACIGSELCRSTVYGLNGGARACANRMRPGEPLEFNMVEAIGCGDRHCRVVAESRKKWPMPPKEGVWDYMGPIATADYIKHTPEEECLKEPQGFREDCGYVYASGTNLEVDEANFMWSPPVAVFIIDPAVKMAIKQGLFTEEQFLHTLKCVCEASGKAAYGERFAIEALRDWLGVPHEIGYDDGRVLGGYIEMYLQGRSVKYTVEAFNKNEVIYQINRKRFAMGDKYYAQALINYWYGMCRTLVNTQWALWEEDSTADTIRIKIAKRLDKFA